MIDIFSKEDYMSDNGMLTGIWGPSLWHVLHTVSFNYPTNPSQEQQNDYYNFILSLEKILPCKYCRENFKGNLKKIKFGKKSLKNRSTFSKAIYNLHEEVNSMLNKPSELSYDEVKNRYEHFRARCLNEKKSRKVLKGGSVKELGCVESFYGKKSKCVLQIVPKNSKTKTFKMSSKCQIDKLVS